GASQGSIIVELALLASTALPLAKAINLILDSMVKYREFQLKTIEVREMKKGTPELEQDFEEDATRWEARADRLKESTVDTVFEEMKTELPEYREGADAELRSAIKRLVEFL